MVVKNELADRQKQFAAAVDKVPCREVEAVTWIAMPLVARGMRLEKAVQMILDRKGYSY